MNKPERLLAYHRNREKSGHIGRVVRKKRILKSRRPDHCGEVTSSYYSKIFHRVLNRKLNLGKLFTKTKVWKTLILTLFYEVKRAQWKGVKMAEKDHK